jgi:hypothetical protein
MARSPDKPASPRAPWDPAAAFRAKHKIVEAAAPERPATLAAHRRNVEARRELGRPKKGATPLTVAEADDSADDKE